MRYILSVEDSRFFASIIKKGVEDRVDAQVICVETMAEAHALLESGKYEFFLALLDMKLPDALNGEVVDLVARYGIPIIVFSGSFDDTTRTEMNSRPIVDYIVKENPASLTYLVGLVQRLIRNTTTKVLYVDDSVTARSYVTDLLKRYQFQVFEVSDGTSALELLKEHSDIRLVLTDYNMPVMNGIELTREVRRQFTGRYIGIIGFSTAGNSNLSAKFLKSGADDFLTKPFLCEEFICRIHQNINLLDSMEELECLALTDTLTGLSNRRSFFNTGEKLLATSKRHELDLTFAMIDIDHFKRFNDTWGHEAGDSILRHVSSALKSICRETDILARVGGEEFALISVNMGQDHAPDYFEKLRRSVAEIDCSEIGPDVSVSISVGVNRGLSETLEEGLKAADAALYAAKENGRNQVKFAA